MTKHSCLSCRGEHFLDSSEQHPRDLRTRVGYGFPTIDDLEIDFETEPIDLDVLSVTRETEILRASSDAALPMHGIMEKQRRIVERTCVNLGHPHHDQFVRVLRAAKSLPQVIRSAQELFCCPDRNARKTTSRSVSWGRHVSCRFVWEDFSVTEPGTPQLETTNYPLSRQDLTATDVWLAFALLWLRPFGAPEILISDGSPKFHGMFSRKIELLCVQHHVKDADGPWQNGRVERHGQ